MRVNLGHGKWFDTKKAQHWDESTYWNGNNHISSATNSQWDHERLYKTKSGIFVVHAWSQWQGSTPSYREISEEEAYEWLMKNEHWEPVPAEFLESHEI